MIHPMCMCHSCLPGKLIGAIRPVGVAGGKTKVPGIPGDGSATHIQDTNRNDLYTYIIYVYIIYVYKSFLISISYLMNYLCLWSIYHECP